MTEYIPQYTSPEVLVNRYYLDRLQDMLVELRRAILKVKDVTARGTA